MPLQILSGKGAVQIMPFRKLGGKCHFLLRFCTRKRSETYSWWFWTGRKTDAELEAEMMDRALKESLDAASTQDADSVNEQRMLEMAPQSESGHIQGNQGTTTDDITNRYSS